MLPLTITISGLTYYVILVFSLREACPYVPMNFRKSSEGSSVMNSGQKPNMVGTGFPYHEAPNVLNVFVFSLTEVPSRKGTESGLYFATFTIGKNTLIFK